MSIPLDKCFTSLLQIFAPVLLDACKPPEFNPKWNALLPFFYSDRFLMIFFIPPPCFCLLSLLAWRSQDTNTQHSSLTHQCFTLWCVSQDHNQLQHQAPERETILVSCSKPGRRREGCVNSQGGLPSWDFQPNFFYRSKVKAQTEG